MTYNANLAIAYIIKDDISHRYTLRCIRKENKIVKYLHLLNIVK